uniref:carboxypeptidase-like regulatory domain-containing protein n=1 Tax=Pedobacter sp. TaxID=1411316 RepID=UPI003D7FA524
MKKLLQILFVLLCIAHVAVAQDRTITGTVTSSPDGTTLPGATVKIRGSQTGTQTSATGKYSLTVPSSTTTLEFSFVGYVVQTVPVGSSNIINVALVSDGMDLTEVVVT